MRSLERRLQLGLALSLILLLGLVGWAGALAVRGLTEGFVASRLEHDAEQVLALAAKGQLGDHAERTGRVPPVYRKPFSGHYFKARLPDGTEHRSRSLWDHDLPLPDLQPGQRTRFYIKGPLDQSLLVLAGGYAQDGGRLTVGVAEDLRPLEREIRRFAWVLAGVLLAFLIGVLAVQRVILRRSFRQLEPVREDIRRLAEGEIGAVREDVPSEIRPLVRELNRLLELLARRLERSRHALGNLAHALKGPLSLLQRALEDPKEPIDRPSLGSQVDRIRALIERELGRARVAGAGQAGQLFEPGRDLPDLIEAVRRMHGAPEMEIRLDDRSEGALPLDREDMLELLGNLLDNACKWGRSQARVQVLPEGDSVELSIEDDGPGVSDAVVEQLTRRGVRADESLSGHGLGLAIAKDIVKLYGGDMRFGRSEALGGLRVSVHLPRRRGLS